MTLNSTVNSGSAYLLSLAAIIGYAFFSHAPFTEFFFAIGSLYGWHTGRRLWRQFKCGTLEVQGPDPSEAEIKGMTNA